MKKNIVISIYILLYLSALYAQVYHKEYFKTDYTNYTECKVTVLSDTIKINLHFTSKLPLLKILKRGFTCYFYPNGDKLKNLYLIYPNKNDIKNRWRSYDLNYMTHPKVMPTNATLVRYGRVKQIPLAFSNTGIKVNIEYNEGYDMNYNIIMPTKNLFTQKMNTFDKFFIEFECGDYILTEAIRNGGLPLGFETIKEATRDKILQSFNFIVKIKNKKK